MRAKVAAQAGGHAFEQRFLDLNFLQLRILYQHAREEERKKRQETIDFIKVINDRWVDNFQSWFNKISFYSNPTVYQKLEEAMRLDDVKIEEITTDNFEEEWQNILATIPNEIHVQYDEQMSNIPEVEEDEFLAGLTPYYKRIKEG